MNYNLFFDQPNLHLIRIVAEFSPSANQPQTLFLSRWRPGRYELGPYIENICDVSAETASGKPLQVTKTAYNAWQVDPSAGENIRFTYKYYAIDRGAGGSNFDATQVYLNPVNLFVYRDIAEPCTATLHLPQGWQMVSGMKSQGNTLHAADFHELADCPVFAAAEMNHLQYEVEGIPFHLWVLGRFSPDAEKIKNDFAAFSRAQMRLFGGAPFSEYHFLYQMHDAPFYHGVEHHNSTVIALGPAVQLMTPALYEEMLGISSHELFHAWNVKAIRPADMQPYRYDEPNYSRLHWVTEGITTYYGDVMLLKSGVWNLGEFLSVFNDSTLKKYYATDSHRHISLEESSFDSWINGYKDTVPNRRVSFYSKGAIVAFLMDYRIRKASANRFSLDDVLREMYVRFGKTAVGYTKDDYRAIAEKYAGVSLADYFEKYISGITPLEPELSEAAAYFGLVFNAAPHPSPGVRRFGFGVEGALEIKQIFEGSPAEAQGMEKGDRIIAINNLEVNATSYADTLNFFAAESSVKLTWFRRGTLMEKIITADAAWKPVSCAILPDPSAGEAAVANCRAWMQVLVESAVV